MLTAVNFSPAPPAFLAAAVPQACVHTVHRRTRGRFTLAVLPAAAARCLHRRLPVCPHRTPQSQSPKSSAAAAVARRNRPRAVAPLRSQAASPPPSLASINGALGNNSEGNEGENKERDQGMRITLDLGENKLHGRIPTWIGRNLWSLRVLRLRSNFLNGTIPMNIADFTSLQVLDLSSNNLTGSLPSSLGNFSAMVETQNDTGSMLHIDNYYYEESILMTTKGSTIDYTTILSLVTSIDLSNNHLSGEIPKELTKLLGLRFLNLSNNHLTGRIPEKIGDMKQLESLDLSMNSLTGEIPSSFSAMNFLDYLNLSYNNLSGKIPTSGQLSTFGSWSYVGNKDLCGTPLPDCPVYQTPPDARVKDDEKLDKLLEYTSIVVGFVVGFWLFIGTLIMKQAIRFAFFRRIDKTIDWMYVQFAVKLAKLKSKWQTMT
nr:PREDICTED: LRR receptor-like serine/threonine-protein kinase GSO1 [Musa acuminata subsp. malaccensis]